MKQRRRKLRQQKKVQMDTDEKKVSNILSKSVRDAIYLESKTTHGTAKIASLKGIMKIR